MLTFHVIFKSAELPIQPLPTQSLRLGVPPPLAQGRLKFVVAGPLVQRGLAPQRGDWGIVQLTFRIIFKSAALLRHFFRHACRELAYIEYYL